MRILGIETSGSAASCAILNDEKLEGEIYLNHKLQHSVILFPMIQKLLDEVEICMDDVDAVAVSGGPGSFTGLRIGVAAAKGIAQGGNKRFCAISSLDAMAFQAAQFNGIICPIVDALREDVYTAFYTWQGGELFKTKDYDVLNIDELLQILYEKTENIIFCGDAVQKYKNKIEEKLENRVCFQPLSYSLPKASSLAELAKIKIEKGMEDDIYTYSPIYIRKSQAERSMKRKMANQPINYEICDMNFRHIEEVVKIEKLSFNTAWTKADFISELEINKAAKYRVLIIDEHVAAYGGMWVLLNEAHVTNIAVHPEYRGFGLGKAILKDLINTAVKNGASSMTLEVRKGNNVAINLYKKFGFVEEGIRKKYYADTGDDAIIMWKYDLKSSDS